MTGEDLKAGGVEANVSESSEAISLSRLSRAVRSYGSGVYSKPQKLSYTTREALYRQEPMLQRGITKRNGDLLKHGFTLMTPSMEQHKDDDVVQAWLRDGFTVNLLNLALISADLHGDGFVEIEWDDGGNDRDPVQEGSLPVTIHVIDPASVRFMDAPGEDGESICYLVQDQFGGQPVVLHPDRFHQFKFKSLPGFKHGISTVEVAYHAALSKVKGDQGIGETLYFSGTPKVLATVKDGRAPELDEVAKMLNDPDFVRGFVWNDRLDVKQLNPFGMSPGPYYDVLEASIAAAVGIPVMMLRGAQAGAVTGSETNLSDYASDLMQLRVMVLEPFYARLVAAILKEEPTAFDFDWLEPAPDAKTQALVARDQATAFTLLTGGGFTREAAARIAGIDLDDDDFEAEVEGVTPQVPFDAKPEATAQATFKAKK